MYVEGQVGGLAMDGVIEELRRTMTVIATFIVLFFVMVGISRFYLFEAVPRTQ